tara:strand:+ start:23787 stop:23927 length:141 start_codon:yes stop_codon:yes gene_type:complete
MLDLFQSGAFMQAAWNGWGAPSFSKFMLIPPAEIRLNQLDFYGRLS